MNSFIPRLPLAGPWKTIPTPHPHVTVSGIAYDADGFFPIIYRSDKVRSAKNCWSIPSGLHEVGLTIAEQFCVELKEELNLDADVTTARNLGFYENIALVDSFHWAILLLTVKVETLDTIHNKEPDRHPTIEIVHWCDIRRLVVDRQWAPNLGQALVDHFPEIARQLVMNVPSTLGRSRLADLPERDL